MSPQKGASWHSSPRRCQSKTDSLCVNEKQDRVSQALLRKLFECEGIPTETLCPIFSEKRGERGRGKKSGNGSVLTPYQRLQYEARQQEEVGMLSLVNRGETLELEAVVKLNQAELVGVALSC